MAIANGGWALMHMSRCVVTLILPFGSFGTASSSMRSMGWPSSGQRTTTNREGT